MKIGFEEIMLPFEQESVLRMSHIEQWLVRYSSTYEEKSRFVKDHFAYDLRRGFPLRFPCTKESKSWKIFVNLYSALDTLQTFYKREVYFMQQMIAYRFAKNNLYYLKRWIMNNED